MTRVFPAFVILCILAIAGWLAWGSISPEVVPALGEATTTVSSFTDQSVPVDPIGHACDADGKMCPDGSVVGRVGPLCEFAACPAQEELSASIHASIGQTMTGLSVSITPRDVLDDSRCPIDVQCIWAGTAHVKATIKTPGGTSDVTFELGHAERVGEYSITLASLTPDKRSQETISDSSYRFEFRIEKA